ncbi:MAG: ABC transporter permease [Lachnospiraceae bacterium]|nr:ABC transporter permease [Lachnospiraceae bacterium]
MTRYVLKRIIWLIPVFFGIVILIFSIIYISPSDPAAIILGPGSSLQDKERIREELGLNGTYFQQLGNYLYNLCVHGDFGDSYVTQVPVISSILQRLPNTLLIGSISMVLVVICGIPLGIFAATHQNKLGDNIATLAALIGVSIPQFWLALMLVVVFSSKLHWLPAFGVNSWTSYILPCIAVSVSTIAGLTRQTRSSMLEVIRSDYITTARAKGVSERAVVYKHALPNALMPLITYVGSELGVILGGTVVIETIFTIPGIGTYMTSGINNSDLPVVEGCVIILGMTFSVVMLLVDIAYAFADPRIREQYSKKKRKN